MLPRNPVMEAGLSPAGRDCVGMPCHASSSLSSSPTDAAGGVVGHRAGLSALERSSQLSQPQRQPVTGQHRFDSLAWCADAACLRKTGRQSAPFCWSLLKGSSSEARLTLAAAARAAAGDALQARAVADQSERTATATRIAFVAFEASLGNLQAGLSVVRHCRAGFRAH